ncbi:MAG TPA: energy-coupling factor transporter transmembrane component T [Candidatus Limnocylindrales bacterium]|nr:energy-coupling factor transporter transmembrane component T [Candidatus Limnocylindrales bacterium]
MIAAIEVADRQLESPLGRANALTKLAIAVAWLIGLATTTSPWPALFLAATAILAGIALGGLSPGSLVRGAAPLLLAAISVGFFNAVFAAANTDPAATEIARIGPLRLTAEGVAGGIGLAARIVAIAFTSVVFAGTTDSTRLVDALVQQARLPARFGYGALAAYQAVPRLGEDLATLRQARRIRGLPGSWHPRLLVSLLVLAIRHGDRLALAMDARGFGSGPRTFYRSSSFGPLDAAFGAGAAAALIAALALGR